MLLNHPNYIVHYLKMVDEIFDFGFTAVNEDELESVQAAAQHEQTVATLTAKVEQLYKSILPLLANLEKNSEKDYIFWPNRTAKIEEFRQRITDIYNNND